MVIELLVRTLLFTLQFADDEVVCRGDKQDLECAARMFKGE